MTEPLSDSDQLTVFLDANGRLHAYDGAGIIDIHRLDGLDRAAALDRLRNAIDADYARAVVERSVPDGG